MIQATEVSVKNTSTEGHPGGSGNLSVVFLIISYSLVRKLSFQSFRVIVFLTMASFCQPTAPTKSPIIEFISCWADCTTKERDCFDFIPWRTVLREYLVALMDRGRCFDLHNQSRRTKCVCMQTLKLSLLPEDMEQVIN